MKKLNYILFIVLPFLFLGSQCKEKVNQANTRTLKGRIMKNCTTPAANVELTLKPDFMYADVIKGGTTDENGYFEITYVSKSQYHRLYAPYRIMDRIPSTPAVLDLGEVIESWVPNYYIRLEVNNPHTMYDTLVCLGLTLPGPFQSGIVDTFYNQSIYQDILSYGETPTWNFAYFLRPFENQMSKHCRFESEMCDESLKEAVLVID